MTILGFCLVEQQDVAITLDRRCLVDHSLVIAPSTACIHQRLLNSGWQPCTAENVCKPVVAGAWRNALKQQAKAVKKRDEDRVAVETVRPGREFVCCECGRSGLKYGGMGRCSTCYQRQRARLNGRKPKEILDKVSCPVCSTPFTPHSMGVGRERKRTCSQKCGRVLRTRTRVAA